MNECFSFSNAIAHFLSNSILTTPTFSTNVVVVVNDVVVVVFVTLAITEGSCEPRRNREKTWESSNVDKEALCSLTTKTDVIKTKGKDKI